jgi:hypothetical protein
MAANISAPSAVMNTDLTNTTTLGFAPSALPVKTDPETGNRAEDSEHFRNIRRAFRSCIRDADQPVRKKLTLDREVPALEVTGLVLVRPSCRRDTLRKCDVLRRRKRQRERVFAKERIVKRADRRPYPNPRSKV